MFLNNILRDPQAQPGAELCFHYTRQCSGKIVRMEPKWAWQAFVCHPASLIDEINAVGPRGVVGFG